MPSSSSPLLLSFPWPTPPHSVDSPVWNGSHFTVGPDVTTSVLTYTDADSHWSDDLTLIHEAEAGGGDHPIDVASRRLALRTLRRHVDGRPGVVLDAGCSSGFLLREIRGTFPELSLIGSDYIAGPLHRLTRILPDVPLLQFDLRRSPLPDACLDAVVCLNVLEHVDQDEVALHEIYRMLRPGGVAHIEVPAGPSCYDIYDEFLMHHRRYTMRDLSAKARGAGFSILQRTHLGAFVFPAFYLVKRRNRRLLKLSDAAKAEKVRTMMRKTRTSPLMALAIRLELLLGRVTPYPFGIRCVIVLRK